MGKVTVSHTYTAQGNSEYIKHKPGNCESQNAGHGTERRTEVVWFHIGNYDAESND